MKLIYKDVFSAQHNGGEALDGKRVYLIRFSACATIRNLTSYFCFWRVSDLENWDG